MTVYQQARKAVKGLAIGETRFIPIPEKLPAFRKFLTDISDQEKKRFTTKQAGKTLIITRLPAFTKITQPNE